MERKDIVLTSKSMENKDMLDYLFASLEQAMKDRERSDETIAAIRESLDASLRSSLQQAFDTSVELVKEIHRDTRERRFPFLSRIQQCNR